MRHVFKLRSVLKGKHIHTIIFSGNEGQTLANIGTLVQDVGEWQLFGALLKCGSELNAATKRDSLVIFEGGEQVINELEMNDELQKCARDTLKEGLERCSDGQQMLFKHMYAHGNLDMPINDVIDNMDSDRLDWAMDQVKRTLEMKKDGVKL